MATIQKIALFLTIIGALNWGCIGLFLFDPVATAFGQPDAFFTRSIYTIIGISGIMNIILLWSDFPEKKRHHNTDLHPQTSK